MTIDRSFEPPTAPLHRPDQRSGRRFNLSDMAIVIVAAGVFFALARHAWMHHPSNNVDIGYTFYTPSSALRVALADRLALGLEVAGTGVVVASYTLVALRLRRPRPRLRRVFRQPGFAATLGASIASGVVFASDSLDGLLLKIQEVMATPALAGDPFPGYRFKVFSRGSILAGFVAVLVTWLLLRWDARWRVERSWLDRSGRLVGWAWLVLLPVGQLFVQGLSLFE